MNTTIYKYKENSKGIERNIYKSLLNNLIGKFDLRFNDHMIVTIFSVLLDM